MLPLHTGRRQRIQHTARVGQGSGVAGVLAALCGSQIRRPPFKEDFLLVRIFVNMPLKLHEFLSSVLKRTSPETLNVLL